MSLSIFVLLSSASNPLSTPFRTRSVNSLAARSVLVTWRTHTAYQAPPAITSIRVSALMPRRATPGGGCVVDLGGELAAGRRFQAVADHPAQPPIGAQIDHQTRNRFAHSRIPVHPHGSRAQPGDLGDEVVLRLVPGRGRERPPRAPAAPSSSTGGRRRACSPRRWRRSGRWSSPSSRARPAASRVAASTAASMAGSRRDPCRRCGVGVHDFGPPVDELVVTVCHNKC